jgi:hypothetical protein
MPAFTAGLIRPSVFDLALCGPGCSLSVAAFLNHPPVAFAQQLLTMGTSRPKKEMGSR